MDDALQFLESELYTEISEYTLCAKKYNDGFYHTWYLGSDDTLDEAKVAETLDTYLKEANKNYKVARSKALKGLKVTVIPISIFHDWNDRNKKKGGQVKMERVMGTEKFETWENFVKEVR